MEEKKIGVLSIISLVTSVIGVILAIAIMVGVPVLFSILFVIAAIVLGIIALIRKEKAAMPVIGISLGIFGAVVALVVGVTTFLFSGVGGYVRNTVENVESEYNYLNSLSDSYNFNSLYNNTSSYDFNSLYNTNSYNFNSLYNTTNTTNSLYTNTTTNTTNVTSDGQKVGTVSDGYVVVPKNWNRFYDTDASGVFQYSYANVYIVTLKGIGSSTRTIGEMAEIMKEHIAAEGTTNIDVSDANIGGYAAKRVRAYYPADNVWLDMYYISINNKLYYISIEGPDKDSDYFKIPNTFTLY